MKKIILIAIAILTGVILLTLSYKAGEPEREYWEARAKVVQLECEAEEQAPCRTYYVMDNGGTILTVKAEVK